jgi:2-iminobutanoate/2-iminopropanoate deaminase
VERPPASSALPGQPGTLAETLAARPGTLAARPHIATPGTGRTVPADRKIVRVELLSLYLENWKLPASVGGRAGDKINAPGIPGVRPCDRRGGLSPGRSRDGTGHGATETMSGTAGLSLDKVLKCQAHCISVHMSPVIDAIHAPYFPAQPSARTFVVPA